MKGIIIEQIAVEGINDWLHGGGMPQHRLWIPEAKNMLLWVHNGVLNVIEFDSADAHKVVREVEVSEEVVNLAKGFHELQHKLGEKLKPYNLTIQRKSRLGVTRGLFSFINFMRADVDKE